MISFCTTKEERSPQRATSASALFVECALCPIGSIRTQRGQTGKSGLTPDGLPRDMARILTRVVIVFGGGKWRKGGACDASRRREVKIVWSPRPEIKNRPRTSWVC